MDLILISILGVCFGSFINVIIYRLPNNLSIISPRSFCPKCKHSIPSYRNIPLISYIIQLGHCYNCNKKISLSYPIIEAITCISWIYFYTTNDNSIDIIFDITMISFLIPLGFIDFKYMFFPIPLIIPLVFISMYHSLFSYYYFGSLDQIYGIIIPLIFFGIIYFLVSYWFKLKKVKKQPMGFGDILLIIPLGAWIGPLEILVSIFLASLIALIIWGVLYKLNLLSLENKMPFGPHLIISTIILKVFNITNLFDVTFQTI